MGKYKPVYSVDMIKFVTQLRKSDWELLCNTILNIPDNPDYELWESKKIGTYNCNVNYNPLQAVKRIKEKQRQLKRHLDAYEPVAEALEQWEELEEQKEELESKLRDLEDNGFWFAFGNVAIEQPTALDQQFVIRYNPNKVKLSGVLEMILKFVSQMSCGNWEVRGCDIAVDYRGVPRSSVHYNKSPYRESHDYFKNGSLTTYIGKINTGQIRIYDKAKEQGLKDLDWTRVEFTIPIKFDLRYFRGLVLEHMEMNIPDIFINVDAGVVTDSSSGMDVNYRCYLRAIIEGHERIESFSRRKKEKLQNLLTFYSQQKLDDSAKPQIIKGLQLYLEYFTDSLNIETLPF